MTNCHNPGFTLMIFLKFCTIKEAKRYLKIILTVYQKNIQGYWVIFGIKNYKLSLQLTFYARKGAKRYMKIILMFFQKKMSFGAIRSFSALENASSYLLISSNFFKNLKNFKNFVKIMINGFSPKFFGVNDIFQI